MTITTNDVRQEYTATASQTVFNYNFKIYESTDLDVYVNGSLTTAYTVSGVGSASGGTITLPTPSTSGDLVTIVSGLPLERQTNYVNNGDFKPTTVNQDIDRTVSLVKQVEDATDRALKIPSYQQGYKNLTVPIPDPYKLLRWNSDGTGLENVSSLSSTESQTVKLESFTATSGQTLFTFSQSYSPSSGRLAVFLDGVKLAPIIDYAETSSNSITLTTGALVGQRLDAYIGAFIEATLDDAENISYSYSGEKEQTVSDKLDRIVWLNDYSGSDPTGSNDNTAALLQAISDLPSTGGCIYVDDGDYRLDSNIPVNKFNVLIVGKGSGGDQSGISDIRDSASTRFFRGGSSTDPMFTFESLTSPKSGGGIIGCMVDSMQLATVGVEIKSWRRGMMLDVFCYGATSSNIWTGATSTTLDFQPYDTQEWLFQKVRAYERNLGTTAYACTLTGGQGDGGANGGNTSFNTFIDCIFDTNGSLALKMESTDNNYFYGCGIESLELGSVDQDSSSYGLGYARHNQFHGCEIKTIYCKAGQSGGDSSRDNLFVGLSMSNGATRPSLQSGGGGSANATALWITTEGEIGGRGIPMGNNGTQTGYAATALGAATLAIGNSSSNHIVLTNGTDEWGFNINASTGDIRISRGAGSGTVDLEATTSASATAGTGGALPATVEKYAIIKVNGVSYKLPLYLA